ncbi:MAG TPA: HK97 gp10 family phage protein [Marmoricola sp.]|nr:HK97 gp10 family phage protein [Marmoricola sp.]
MDAIRIQGLSQLARSLRRLDSEAPKALRVALNVGAEVIVRGARQAGFPRRTGLALSTLRAQSTRTAVRVTEGGKKAPYVPWLDFGGTIRLSNRRLLIKRPFLPEGRYLYRSYYDNQEKLTATLERALIDLIRSVGLAED